MVGEGINVLSPPSNKQKWFIFTLTYNIQMCLLAVEACYYFLLISTGIQKR